MHFLHIGLKINQMNGLINNNNELEVYLSKFSTGTGLNYPSFHVDVSSEPDLFLGLFLT